jgi:hypothetical protein
MDPVERAFSAGRRLAGPVESVAQAAARRATGVVLDVVDVNAVLDLVDLDELLARVDVNRLLSRVDLQALLDRADLTELAGRVDFQAIAEQSGLAAFVAQSTSTLAGEALDAVRDKAAGADRLLERAMGRVLRRRSAGPPGPPLLTGQAPR